MIDNNINKWFHSIFYRERLVKGRGIVEDWKTRLQIKYPSLQSNISRVNIYHIVIKLLIIYCDSPITDNHRIFNRRIDDRSERKSIMTFNLRHTTCLRSIRLIMTYMQLRLVIFVVIQWYVSNALWLRNDFFYIHSEAEYIKFSRFLPVSCCCCCCFRRR